MAVEVEKLENKVAGLTRLPTLPIVVREVARLIGDGAAGAADLAAVISTDQVLCSRILRLVNSPVYGFPGRISSVKHALVLLGMNVVKGLVLGSSLFGSACGDWGRRLWRHSLGCAVVSRRIAREIGMVESEEVMVAGLLHDLGKVVLLHLYPSEYEETLAVTETRRCHVSQTEREVFGADHAMVSGWMARQWCFPPRISDPLQYHHRPETASHAPDVAAVVHVADILARALGYGHPGDPVMPKAHPIAFRGLGLSADRLDRVLEDIDVEYDAGACLFDAEDR